MALPKMKEMINEIIADVAGQDVLPLVNILKGKKNISEFTLAEQLKEEINTIRNKLYRLYDAGLVVFIRKKDKKKGWYIYYWTFVPSKIPEISIDLKKKKIEHLNEQLQKEKSINFFECLDKCMRLTFEQAVDVEFKCPECGSLMNQQDNAGKIENIQAEIEKLEKEIAKQPEMTVPKTEDEAEEPDEEGIPVTKQKRAKAKIKHTSRKKSKN